MSLAAQPPTLDVDIFSDDVMLDPYPTYRVLRDTAPAVYMPAHSVWAIGRYADIRPALLDFEAFSSARGTEMLEDLAQFGTIGTIIGTDPPEHDVLRSVMSEKLAPRALKGLRDHIYERADLIVRAAVAQGTFDAVSDLAQRLPVDVVADLIGLPKEGRHMLIEGADAIFHAFGPLTPRLQERLPKVQAYLQYTRDMLNRDVLAPDSWGTAVLDAADEGRLPIETARTLMSSYMIAGIDTTVNSIGNFIRFLADRPDVWDALKEDPALIPSAYEEILRMESPVQGFFRTATRDVDVDGTVIPENSRVLICFGAGNRDERRYPDPDTFDIRRNPTDHLAFGYGTHGCAGQGLARIEVPALISSLLRHADSIRPAGDAVQNFSPVVRSLEALPVTVTPSNRD
jgi:cytochrome P450